jgi:hypothetical protein
MGTSVLFIYFHDVSDISTLRPEKHASMHPEPCIMSWFAESNDGVYSQRNKGQREWRIVSPHCKGSEFVTHRQE